MVKAVRVHSYGGPEALSVDEIEVGAPGPGEVLVRHTAVGLNFIDTYHRSGLYKLERLPHTLGVEGAGVIEAAGAEVTDLAPGDRVAYAGSIGSYCEMRVMDAGRLVKLPDGIGDQQAAAMMLQGMTVWYLIRRTYPVKKGETVLFHAAAGGVGLIACHWLKHLGATVIGTVGSEEKAELARAHGCAHTINY
ncbi:MAG: quinone oxidoreductase, partial [Alphaproteobacteria bacterium]|nr:quinone oxidoreductase [Alphaproteobacteria bacterium]